MFEYEIEVHGHYTATISVTAETQDEAEILAVEMFEQDYLPYSNDNGWTDVWNYAEVEGVISSTETESEEY